MNFKNMTYREISRITSSFTSTADIDRATRQLDELIDSLTILRNMLEGRKTLQLQKEKIRRRRGLTVVPPKNKDKY